jgi:hypothetical protein
MSDILEDREPLRVLGSHRHDLQVYRRFPSPRAFLELGAVVSGLTGFWLLMNGVLS